MFTLRPMQPDDLPAALSIQQDCYAGTLLEDSEVFAARLDSHPEETWIAADAQGTCGYLFAYRSRIGMVTPLDGVFPHQPDADCLYLHDLAVARRAAGLGIGPAMVRQGLQQAVTQGLRYSALVSVQDSHGFWSRLGYSAHRHLDETQQMHLASYQTPAIYMVRNLAA